MAQRYKTEDSQCFKSKGAEDGRLDKLVEDRYASRHWRAGGICAHTWTGSHRRTIGKTKNKTCPCLAEQGRGTLNNLGFFASYMLIYLQSTLQYNRVKLVCWRFVIKLHFINRDIFAFCKFL